VQYVAEVRVLPIPLKGSAPLGEEAVSILLRLELAVGSGKKTHL
jgi:hypothetical protein